jgi:hypothetical protein
MKEEALLQVIQFFYPTARYVAVAPVAAGRLEGEEDQQSYVYASLYDHKVGSQMRPIGDHLVVINNTYISSFAYNVALCHLVGSARRLSPGDLARLYRHNFKKFFAEQVAYLQNVLVGRAWLIETTLYETRSNEERLCRRPQPCARRAGRPNRVTRFRNHQLPRAYALL